MIIETDRLALVPMTPDFLRASLSRDREEAEALLGADLPGDWPLGVEDLLGMRLADLEEDPALQPWLLRAMILHGTRTMVGYAGFHSAPGPAYLQEISPGAVEMGWTVLPAFRRRGFARETCLAFMEWARRYHHVPAFILSIAPENAPSLALAQQLGFVKIGSHVDEVDGPEDIYELRLESRHRHAPGAASVG